MSILKARADVKLTFGLDIKLAQKVYAIRKGALGFALKQERYGHLGLWCWTKL
jgi:hypothetical protein